MGLVGRNGTVGDSLDLRKNFLINGTPEDNIGFFLGSWAPCHRRRVRQA